MCTYFKLIFYTNYYQTFYNKGSTTELKVDQKFYLHSEKLSFL
jgi:hypothetical protein